MSDLSTGRDAELVWLCLCDSICDDFEQAWRAGGRPQLAAFVERAPADRQPDLLRALLALDRDYRVDAGEAPQTSDYSVAWPDQTMLIAEVLAFAPQSRRIGKSERIDDVGSTQLSGVSLESTVTAAAKTAVESAPDDFFGDYRLIREAGRGGMGVVYLARHVRLDRLAAVKVIRSGELAGADEIRRFEAEAAAAAQLDHPGIVPVYESGQHGSHHFLAMAWIEGESLWHRIQDRPLEPQAAAGLIEEAALAIQHAHDRGIVHRDLKPQNILMTINGHPRVTDFGLAKRFAANTQLTATGDVLGTPSYMPPEQASGRMDQVGPLGDVYSLGATLYCALTGRPPFQAANAWDTMRQVCEQEPVSPRDLNPATPRDLETICLKCLRKLPAQRYAAAAELAADLRRFLTGVPILARPISPVERGWRWCRRNRWIAGSSALTIALLVVVASVSTWAWSRQSFLTQEMTKLAGEEKLQRERYQVQLHHSQVARAAAALDAGNFTRAEAALDDAAPLHLRGWEYRHLKRRLMGTPLTIRGDGYPLMQAAYSPDGRRLAMGSLIGEVHVWRTADGQREQHFKIDGGSIRTMLFHPAREELILVMLSGSVTCWSLTDQKPRLTWQAHLQSVGGAAITADGSSLATCSADSTVKLWDLATGAEQRTFRGHQLPVQCVDISPDGKTAVSGGAHPDAKFELIRWKLWDGEILKQTSGEFHAVNQVRFHPDGTRLATVTGVGVTLWDASSLEQLQSMNEHKGAVTSIAFSPDGTRLSTTSFDGQVRVFHAATGELLERFGHHAEMTQNTAFSPDGYRLASVSGTLKLRGAAEGQYTAGELKVWNLKSLEADSWIAVDERHVDPVTNYLNSLAFQPGTAAVATGGWRGKVRLVDVIRREDLQSPIDFGSVITSLNFHPRLPILAICGTFNGPHGGIALYDLRQQRLTPLRGHSGQVGVAQFSPDGSVLATGGADGVIRLWNSESAQELGSLPGHKPGNAAITFSPDGRRLVIQSLPENGADEIKVWDVSRRREIKQTPTVSAQGQLSPDGSLRAARTSDGVIEIWNQSDGMLRHRLLGHLADVPGLAFVSDGSRLVSASRDRTIRLWDPREGVEVHRFELENDSPNDVALSSDGSLLACATQAGTVRVWDGRLVGDALKLKAHAAPIDAYGFTKEGTLLSRDTGGRLIAWNLPEGTVDTGTSYEDPAPLPSTSPDGQWTVDVDRRDRSLLTVTRGRHQALPFQPWQEESARMAQSAPAWHAEDAKAAEVREDWFAAAFHLAELRKRSEDADIRRRLQHACLQLTAQQRTRPKNVLIAD